MIVIVLIGLILYVLWKLCLQNMEEKTVKSSVSPSFSDFSANQTRELVAVEKNRITLSLLVRKADFITCLHVLNPESWYIVEFLFSSCNSKSSNSIGNCNLCNKASTRGAILVKCLCIF